MELHECNNSERKDKRFRRHSTSKGLLSKNLNVRSAPEGNSIVEREKVIIGSLGIKNKADAVQKRSLKRKKLQKISDYESGGKTKKPKYSNTSSTEQPLDSLNGISSIHPVEDMSTEDSFKTSEKSKMKSSVTWKNAIKFVRGEPDGAEISQLQKNQSKILSFDDENMKSWKKSKAPNKVKTVEKRKGFKEAIKKLRSLTHKKPDQKWILATKKTKSSQMKWKDRKQQRRMKKNNYQLIQLSKTTWDELRRKDLPEERRKKLCTELFNKIKGNMKVLVFCHDIARVVQCLLQYGNFEQRTAVFEELKEQIILMTESKYSKFLVWKMLKYGSKQNRNEVFRTFNGHVQRLVRHREAAEIIEYAYNEHANASQRFSFMEEFYGSAFSLLKTDEIKSLENFMKFYPSKKQCILENMKESLLPLIKKDILGYTLVHRVFYEFFTYAADSMRSEVISELREKVVNMVHTRDGSRVVMYCIWHGTTKDRKMIIKSLKNYVVKMCKEEYSHLILLSIFDVVDDTKFIYKIILEEMLKSLKDLVMDQYGRKVLTYLIAPRDPLHFHPDVVKILQKGDNNNISKKEKTVQQRELLEFVSKPLLQFVTDNTKELVTNNACLLFLVSVINQAVGNATEAMRAVAQIAGEPFGASTLGDLHMVEHPAGHMTLKKLILNDKERMQNGEKVLFSRILIDTVPEERMKSWATCNRGCFILYTILGVNCVEVNATLKVKLASLKKSLKKLPFKGASLLLEQLTE